LAQVITAGLKSKDINPPSERKPVKRVIDRSIKIEAPPPLIPIKDEWTLEDLKGCLEESKGALERIANKADQSQLASKSFPLIRSSTSLPDSYFSNQTDTFLYGAPTWKSNTNECSMVVRIPCSLSVNFAREMVFVLVGLLCDSNGSQAPSVNRNTISMAKK